MIITVFVTTHSAGDQWRAELLEHSWLESGQPGELVRLVACPAGAALPRHGAARVVRTLPYDPHPYIGDSFPGYNSPAALLEWLVTEPVDASLLVLDPNSVLLRPVSDEVGPGEAMGRPWDGWPAGDGPFGLAEAYAPLRAFCVNRELEPPRVGLPLLIHSDDLRRLAARWLELTALIRGSTPEDAAPSDAAPRVAYTVAAAEYRIAHRADLPAATTKEDRPEALVIDYGPGIEDAEGEPIWDPRPYHPWSKPAGSDGDGSLPAAANEFLGFLRSYVSRRESGALLALRRPRRRPGVREARLPDRLILEVPGAPELVHLNASAGAIWNLCDNRRTLADIAAELQNRFDVPAEALRDDLERAVVELHGQGALELDRVLP